MNFDKASPHLLRHFDLYPMISGTRLEGSAQQHRGHRGFVRGNKRVAAAAMGLLLTATNDRRLASQFTKFNIQKADAGEYPFSLRCRSTTFSVADLQLSLAWNFLWATVSLRKLARHLTK